MTATDTDTTVPAAVQAAKVRIDAAIDALLALRSLAFERPDIAGDIVLDRHGSTRVNAYVGNTEYTRPENCVDVPARIAELAEAAGRHGAALRPDSGNGFGGIRATFGPFEMYIYAPLEQVGAAQVREVTEWQLDPRLTAFGTEASR
jgi:hypothetical protein